MSRSRVRTIPRSFDDTFREGIPHGAAPLGATGEFVVRRAIGHEIDTAGMLVLISFLLTAAFLVNIVWTHLVYTRTEPARIKQILADQQAMPL